MSALKPPVGLVLRYSASSTVKSPAKFHFVSSGVVMCLLLVVGIEPVPNCGFAVEITALLAGVHVLPYTSVKVLEPFDPSRCKSAKELTGAPPPANRRFMVCPFALERERRRWRREVGGIASHVADPEDRKSTRLNS